MTEELVKLDDITAIQAQAKSLYDPAETERLKLALAGVSKITNERELQTVTAVATRTNSIAAEVEGLIDRFAQVYFRKYKELKAISKSETEPILKLKYKALTLIDAHEEALERKQAEDQAKLEQIATEARERDLAASQEAALMGDLKSARELKEQADQIMVPILQPQAPEMPGVARSEEWEWEITDNKAFLKAIVDGVIPEMVTIRLKGIDKAVPVVEPTQSVLNFYAKQFGDKLGWPGVSVAKKRQYRVSRKDL
jgi:hypothetical protein